MAAGRNKKPGAGPGYLLTRAREYLGEGIAWSPLKGMESVAAGKKKARLWADLKGILQRSRATLHSVL